MKKLVLAGIAVLFVMFFVTCDLGQSDENAVVEYTDVEYSADGEQITVYIDGSKPVPVTKAQRAMSKNLSRMAYDYIEVLFVSDTTVARSSWELGQAAGISGVHREATTAKPDANNYLWSATTDGTDAAPLALMFVGRKSDKTLLGIGRILQVDRLPYMKKDAKSAYIWDTASPNEGLPIPLKESVPGSGNFDTDDPGAFKATIVESTTSVTFWIESIKTGLLIKTEDMDTGTSDIEKRVAFDSFKSTDTTNGAAIRGGARRSPLGNANYPLYPLPAPKKITTAGTAPNDTVGGYYIYKADYEFGGGAKTFVKFIVPEEKTVPIADRRFPRYLSGGRYLAPQSNVDTDSEVWVDTVQYATNATTGNGKFSNKIPLLFQPKGYGLFSFYIEIPVYMFKDTKSTNGGEVGPIIWKIRTGLGSELYSLDDGLASGGCVLMGIGVTALDWLEIEWDWVK